MTFEDYPEGDFAYFTEFQKFYMLNLRDLLAECVFIIADFFTMFEKLPA